MVASPKDELLVSEDVVDNVVYYNNNNLSILTIVTLKQLSNGRLGPLI